jgi:hypothetical protein
LAIPRPKRLRAGSVADSRHMPTREIARGRAPGGAIGGRPSQTGRRCIATALDYGVLTDCILVTPSVSAKVLAEIHRRLRGLSDAWHDQGRPSPRRGEPGFRKTQQFQA